MILRRNGTSFYTATHYLPTMSEPKKEKAWTGPLFITIGVLMTARGVLGVAQGMSTLFLLLGIVNIGVGIMHTVKYQKQKKEEDL